jgi:hypothetical protein
MHFSHRSCQSVIDRSDSESESVSRQLSSFEVAKLKDLRGEMAFLKLGEFGSAMVEELPEMFVNVGGSWFVLLWRSTRGGFAAEV